MNIKIDDGVRRRLDEFLESNNHRKTPERYAILEMAYRMDRPFTIEELGEKLEKRKFHVSRATLYATMRLFTELRLVVRHRFLDGTWYEPCYNRGNHCYQICTVCGKALEVEAPNVSNAVEETKFKWFRKDGYVLYVYGICSWCKAKMTRQARMQAEAKKVKTNRRTK
ncbi:MAG: transcriptional repressor [Prevotella sp.]|nr:transcriptional repressor [Prevotella sp.]